MFAPSTGCRNRISGVVIDKMTAAKAVNACFLAVATDIYYPNG